MSPDCGENFVMFANCRGKSGDFVPKVQDILMYKRLKKLNIIFQDLPSETRSQWSLRMGFN